MGSLASRNFVEMLEEEEETFPSTPSVSKRVLDEALDPRSPTCGISRTPIQVLKTPEFVLDPRSPTVGIDRTPICTKFTATEVIEADCSEKSVDVEMSSVAPLNMTELLEEVDSIQSEETPSTDNRDPAEVCQPPVSTDQAKAKPNAEKKVVKKMRTKVIGHTNSEAEGLEGKQTVRSPLKVLGDRSPLTSRNVDYNSPRAIVQRKQASKLGMKKPVLQLQGGGGGRNSSPVKYRPMADDKENL